MNENREYITHPDEMGNIQISEDVLGVIAASAAQEIEGVAGLMGASGGKRGGPCTFPAEFVPDLLALTGDKGGAGILKAHPDRVLLVEVPPEELLDADTPEALAALQA